MGAADKWSADPRYGEGVRRKNGREEERVVLEEITSS